MKIVAVIPVSGREPLLQHTIARLGKQTLPVSVVCCGHTDSEQEVCEQNGALFLNAPTDWTTGAKWQHCIDVAKEIYNPDYILILGSSNFICHDWCEKLIPEITEGVGMIGSRGLYFMDIWHNNGRRMFWWGGYHRKSGRFGEPIGTGRIIPHKTLDALNWQVYEDKRCRLDLGVTNKIRGIGLDVVCSGSDIKGIKVSTHKWRQINKFDAVARYADSIVWFRGDEIDLFLKKEFPEALDQSLYD